MPHEGKLARRKPRDLGAGAASIARTSTPSRPGERLRSLADQERGRCRAAAPRRGGHR